MIQHILQLLDLLLDRYLLFSLILKDYMRSFLSSVARGYMKYERNPDSTSMVSFCNVVILLAVGICGLSTGPRLRAML